MCGRYGEDGSRWRRNDPCFREDILAHWPSGHRCRCIVISRTSLFHSPIALTVAITPESLYRRIASLYTADESALARQRRRWLALLESHLERSPRSEARLFSTPGRTEIGGNHTDHNRGRVLAAAVDLDSIAVAGKNDTNVITLRSREYAQPFTVSLEDLSPAENERGTTTSLIRGTAAGFEQKGYRVGGFDAVMASDVPVGSGLSSSASVEVLIGTILSALYNGGTVGPLEVAKIGQDAENRHFGKPCGLMDQIACAMGGIVAIDFKDPASPLVERVEFDFTAAGVALLVVDTGGTHADLTEDYASIPREMRAVAAQFGADVCREISPGQLFGAVRTLRGAVGDRAILRAMHFLEENDRVSVQLNALRRNDVEAFLRLVRESGLSSFRWLQNCTTVHTVREQGIALALALTERFLDEHGAGACRVHGGGFAGTILIFLPEGSVPSYRELMESAFRPGCVRKLRIRNLGSAELI